jgi:hypothetical protein
VYLAKRIGQVTRIERARIHSCNHSLDGDVERLEAEAQFTDCLQQYIDELVRPRPHELILDEVCVRLALHRRATGWSVRLVTCEESDTSSLCGVDGMALRRDQSLEP